MQPMVVSVGPLVTAAANNICLSQTPSGAGYLTINGALASGGVATLDTPRRILLTTNGNETAKTFTVVGTNWAGNSITEVITGVTSSTATSVLDYKTVISIYVSAATAAAVTFGTTTTAASPWVRFNSWGIPQASIQVVVTGTINYTLQFTLDDPNSADNPVAPAAMTWTSSGDASLVGATGTVETYIPVVPVWARILLNSGTGSARATFVQLGVLCLALFGGLSPAPVPPPTSTNFIITEAGDPLVTETGDNLVWTA